MTASDKITLSKGNTLYQCPSNDVAWNEVENLCVPIGCSPTDQYSAIPDKCDYSLLWGREGELWNPQGRLPYFWSAGYRSGKEPPQIKITKNVLDFGAKPNDNIDDTAAFQKAIQETKNGALFIPAGKYLIRDVMTINHSNIVLRGEPGTTLSIDKSLEDVKGKNEEWSYRGGFLWIEPQNRERKPLTPLTASASRGDWSVAVANTSQLIPGAFIYLGMQDREGSVTLEQELHNHQAWGGHCDWQRPYEIFWPAQVAAIQGETITLTQPLRMNVSGDWEPTIYTGDFVQEVGIENLTIEFPDVPYRGHGNEPGYNAIFFGRGAVNSWVRDVTVINADSGILTQGGSKWITVTEVKLKGRKGHHALHAASCHDCLFEKFQIEAEQVHDLTIASQTSGTVFSRGRATHTMELDHHRNGAFENLFTDIETPTRLDIHGDGCAGPASGARITYWNLSGLTQPSSWSYVQANYIGVLSEENKFTDDREWYENIANVCPANLYEAQKLNHESPSLIDNPF